MRKFLLVILVFVFAGILFRIVKKTPSLVLEDGAQRTPVENLSSLGPGDYTFSVPSRPNRDYYLHVPRGYAPEKPIPAILVLHGGGGNAESAPALTCPGADPKHPDCLNNLAEKESFLVVYPNGSQNPLLKNVRTWNAGGGKDGYVCVSGYACENDFDDVEYFRLFLDDLEKRVNVDRSRIYATGISNGAAMAHRLACELSDGFAAIAPIGFGNQFSANAECKPGRAVPVIEFHGTKDPFATYGGGQGHSPFGKENGTVISIPKTIEDWALRNGCRSNSTEDLPDAANDGTTVARLAYSGCRDNGDVVLYRINEGGHTWPGGWQYLPASIIGKTAQDINANKLMWEFFKTHPMQ